MRPKHLFPIFTHVTRLPGIGPKIGNALERFTGSQIIDLLWHLPSGVIDRRYSPKIADAADGSIATIVITVDKQAPSPGRGSHTVFVVATKQVFLIWYFLTLVRNT